MQVIIISQSASQILIRLAESLSEKHESVLIHTGSRVAKQSSKLRVLVGPKYDNSSYFSRCKTWVRYFFHALQSVLKADKPTLLILSTNPPILPIVGYIANIIKGFPYIIRVLDVFPEVLVRRNLAKESSVICRLWHKLNQLAYNDASLVITLAPMMAQNVSQDLNNSSRLKIIPSWVNTSQFKPVQKKENDIVGQNTFKNNQH